MASNPAPQPFIRLSWDGSRALITGSRRYPLGDPPDPVSDAADTSYARWLWDGTRFELTADRLAFRPLFYAVDGTTLLVSPSIPELLRQGAPDALDDEALAVFLRTGCFLADDTPFQHIRAVPPRASIVWEQGRTAVTQTRPHHSVATIGRDAAMDRYAELFTMAVSRLAQGDAQVIVPLSGGRDSRHILLALHAQGHDVSSVTVRPAPPKSDEDATVAAIVAGAIGIPHTLIGPTADRFADELSKNRLTSLGVLEHFWVMEMLRYLEGRNAVVYDGIAGDTLSEAKYMSPHRLSLFRSGELRRYAEEEVPGDAYLPVALAPALLRRMPRALAVERMERELRTHADAPNPVGSFRFWNRTRRAVAMAPFGILATVATVRAPFLDPDLYDFLSSLPGELLVNRDFHTGVIARTYPAFAALPYESPGAREQPAAAFLGRYCRAALRHGLLARRRAHRPVLYRTAYLSRLGLLLLAGRLKNAAWLATVGIYLSQLEAGGRDH